MNTAMVEAAAHDSVVDFMHVAQQQLVGKTILARALQQMLQGYTTVSEVMRISNQVED
jgi:MSHA biogenesis protein MshE